MKDKEIGGGERSSEKSGSGGTAERKWAARRDVGGRKIEGDGV